MVLFELARTVKGSIGDRLVKVDTTKYRDYYTFSKIVDTNHNAVKHLDENNVYGNHIGLPQTGTNYNNIIFVARSTGSSLIRLNKIDDFGSNLTFCDWTELSTIATFCQNIIFKGRISSLTFGHYCSANIWQDGILGLVCSNAVAHNNFAGAVEASVIDAFFNRNHLKKSLTNTNTMGYNIGSNQFHDSVNSAKILQRINNSKFLGELRDSTIHKILNGKTFNNPIVNANVTAISPDGSVWSSSIDDSGVQVNTKLL